MSMVRQYIFLAAGCVGVGIVLTFVMLAVTQRLGVNIDENLWVVAIPAVLSLFLNIGLLEIYQAYRRRHS
jgi:general stress protein CsbA